MTNEEWNRKAEFLLNQQAKFDADMQVLKQELKESQKISERKIGEVAEVASHAAEAALHVADSVTKLAETVTHFITYTHEGFRSVDDRMKHLSDKIDVLVNSQIHTDKQIQDTAKQLRDTDKRHRDLEDLFERHIRNDLKGRNGSNN